MPDLYSDNSRGETAFCSLSAINVTKVLDEEYEHIAEVALRAVDKMIDLAPAMTEAMKRDITTRRSAGIGIMGLAGALYNKGLDYDGSEDSLEFTSYLAERHYLSTQRLHKSYQVKVVLKWRVLRKIGCQLIHV